ncbi:MAG TPA: nucleotidyltransferase substrate binding protein [Patescibacteria group bacterium]|nr:nucleotidyltransferase substrate binding protein [Patescibacteria group bacterium]
MNLDLSSLQKALATLDEALQAQAVSPENKFIRDACIQRFEYCYEPGHKMLRRYLEESEPTPRDIGDLSFPNLIRLGYERGLLGSEWVEWKGFRDACNITSHAYDERKANDVLAVIPAFFTEAKYLLAQIEKRQEDEA